MPPSILFLLAEFSITVTSMCAAAVVFFLIGLWAVKNEIARANGLDKVVALSNLCFALPLAVFGALHMAAAPGLAQMVPSFVPWHLFWAYFVGFGLLAAALSIATKIQVRWSGLLFGIMMFLFVAMMDLPGTIADPHNRFNWILMLRESAFGGGGWILAGAVMSGQSGRTGNILITIGRVLVGAAAVLYGVETFLHPLSRPGIPLEKMMPPYIPAQWLIGYITGAILVVAGAAILFNLKTRMAATYLGAWIVLLVVLVYGPILFVQLRDPGTDAKIEGLNYFFDTLLWGGTILALASASPRTD